MDAQEQKQLDDYLGRVEKLLSHISVEDRIKILGEVKALILKYHNENNLAIPVVLRQFSDVISLVNVELAKVGRSPIKEKKVRWWKIILLAFFSFFIIGIITIVFAVKSFLPLVNVNDIDGTLELFGSRFVLEKDDNDYFQKINDEKFIQWKKGAKLAKGTFDFGGKVKEHSLSIKLRKGELAIRTHDKDSIRYTCYTQKQLQEIFTKKRNTFMMNLDATQSHCLVFVPYFMKLKIEMGEGNINLKSLQQDFGIHLGKGILSWKQHDHHDYYVHPLFSKNMSGEDDKFSKNGKWKASILIDDGEIRLR